MKNKSLSPYLHAKYKVILFDGVCKLCHVWSRFVMRFDKAKRLKLCAVQSEQGQEILRHYNFSVDHYETMLFVDSDHCYQKSEAFLQVMSVMGMPWAALNILRIFPRCCRDWLYERIALNRYRLFGRFDACQLPSSDHENRYLCDIDSPRQTDDNDY